MLAKPKKKKLLDIYCVLVSMVCCCVLPVARTNNNYNNNNNHNRKEKTQTSTYQLHYIRAFCCFVKTSNIFVQLLPVFFFAAMFLPFLFQNETTDHNGATGFLKNSLICEEDI